MLTSTGAETHGGVARSGLVVFALHAATFAVLLAWSWRKWPDPLVDFGRELYVPWQIINGRVLSRDIASLFGPLSPYVNALWFRLFGVGMMTLALVNAAVFALTIAGIYRLIAPATDRVTAAAATLTAMLLFGCSQYLDVGNYNFITPYSHEATHGLALSVAAMLAWCAAVAQQPRPLAAAVSGGCCGLVLLTKPEIAAALGVAMIVGVAGARWLGGNRFATRRLAVPFAAGLVAPIAAFWLYFNFAGGLPLDAAAGAVANGWITTLVTPVARNAFYARVTGFDHPLRNALQMLASFAGFLGILAAAAALARAGSGRLIVAAQAAVLIAVAFAVPYFGALIALPLIAALGFAAALSAARRERRADGHAIAHLPLLTWSAFAVLMLAKMLLNAQVYHYGFYLALPAWTVAVAVMAWYAPQTIRARYGPDAAAGARRLLIALVAITTAPHLALSQIWFGTKTVAVSTGRDRFLASGGALWQGTAVAQAVRWIDAETRPDETIAVVPEGIMINYLTRRATSVPFVNYMPPEVAAFGEPAMVRAFEARPPDYVLLVDRDTSEYGYASFGSDARYGRRLLTWIRGRYDEAARIGQRIDGGGGEIVVLKRRR